MSLVITLVLIIIATFFFSKTLLLLFSKKHKNYPPCPPKLPIIGNLHQLGPLPHRSLHTLSKKHGPLMLLQLGQVPLLVASSPSMAKEIMKTQDHVFANRPSLKAASKLLYHGKDIAFSPYGEYWKQVRKFSVHYLLSPSMVSSYKTIREDEVVLFMEKIKRRCCDGGAGVVNISEELRWLARDIVIRIGLGKPSREYAGLGDKIHKIIAESSGLLGAFLVGDYLRGFGWLDKVTGLDGMIERSFKEAEEVLGNIVEKEMSGWKEGERDDQSKSFIHILISLEKDKHRQFPFNKENIMALLKDMIAAGTESISVVMEWVMAELVKNPTKLQTLKNEIQGSITAKSTTIIKEEDLKGMQYLKAVIKEALRLHPPGPLLVPRELMKDTQIGPYEIPKNTQVVTNVWAIGRDPQVWESPDEFRPERFLLSSNGVDFKGCDFELIPFGAGRRICPGIQFSSIIIELTVANLVHLFDWKLGGGTRVEDLDMVEVPGITAGRRFDLVLDATPCCF